MTARYRPRDDRFWNWVAFGFVVYLAIALCLLQVRRNIAVSAAQDWVQQQYEQILSGEQLPEGDHDQLLLRSFYYAVAKPFAAKSVADASIFQGGSDSLVAIAVGSAEGTRGPDGSKNPAWHGHDDPCKYWGTCPGRGKNRGSFSYDGAATPEEADKIYLKRLQGETAQIKEYAASIGLDLTLEELLNGIDLANQAPLAALDEMGYSDRLLEAKNKGLSGKEAISHARTRSFIDPDTGLYNAPGLGATDASETSEYRVRHDQERRIDQIADAIAANPDLAPDSQDKTIADDMPGFLDRVRTTGALDALKQGIVDRDGVIEVEQGAFTTALNLLRICGSPEDVWSDYGCEIFAPPNTTPLSLLNDMIWEMRDAQRVDTPPVEPSGDSKEFVHPLPGATFTSGFGWRTHPITGTRKFHNGADWAAPTGTPILAAASGEIIFSGWKSNGYGNQVLIRHPNGYETFYAHCDGVLFEAGTRVEQNAPIAYVGSTGNSTGPHLHFEINPIGGAVVNPCKKLDVCYG